MRVESLKRPPTLSIRASSFSSSYMALASCFRLREYWLTGFTHVCGDSCFFPQDVTNGTNGVFQSIVHHAVTVPLGKSQLLGRPFQSQSHNFFRFRTPSAQALFQLFPTGG